MEEGERIKRIQSYIDIKLKDTEKAIRKYKEREDYLESDYNYLKGYRDAMEDAQIYVTCPAPADGRYVVEMEKKIHKLPYRLDRMYGLIRRSRRYVRFYFEQEALLKEWNEHKDPTINYRFKDGKIVEESWSPNERD
jgi:hypothetical protein|nr:MAG TPA: hypothetical protein [Caudoviricetes sp.]